MMCVFGTDLIFKGCAKEFVLVDLQICYVFMFIVILRLDSLHL